jgi:hypothetical protein
MSLKQAIEGKLHIRYGRTLNGGMSWWYPDKEQTDPKVVVIRDGDCGEVRPTRTISREEWDRLEAQFGLWKRVGFWDFAPAEDMACEAITFCHSNPQAAGRRLHRLENRSCETCKHWADELNSEGRADCRRLEEDGDEWFEKALLVGWPPCGHDGPADTYETAPKFGCNLWEAK